MTSTLDTAIAELAALPPEEQERVARYATHFSTSPGAAYFTRCAVAGSSWCFLDVRCQDVRVACDTNADGLPDPLQAAPFAQSATYSVLLKERSIASHGSAILPRGTYTGVVVSPALVEGDWIGIRFSDGAADQRQFEVEPAHPQIYVGVSDRW